MLVGQSCMCSEIKETRTLFFFPHFSVGHTATHTVLLARLITKGVDYGIHPFIVQLRSMEDHTPLPGNKYVKICLNNECY